MAVFGGGGGVLAYRIDYGQMAKNKFYGARQRVRSHVAFLAWRACLCLAPFLSGCVTPFLPLTIGIHNRSDSELVFFSGDKAIIIGPQGYGEFFANAKMGLCHGGDLRKFEMDFTPASVYWKYLKNSKIVFHISGDAQIWYGGYGQSALEDEFTLGPTVVSAGNVCR